MIHQNKPENNVAQFSWSISRYAPQISVPKSKCGPKVSEKAFGLCPLDPAPFGPKFDTRSVPKNGPGYCNLARKQLIHTVESTIVLRAIFNVLRPIFFNI